MIRTLRTTAARLRDHFGRLRDGAMGDEGSAVEQVIITVVLIGLAIAVGAAITAFVNGQIAQI